MGSSIFGVCLVDFHHKRGPEVEYWVGLENNIAGSKLWPNLPFQALPDGSHSFEETFTYFTLLYDNETMTSPQNMIRGESTQDESIEVRSGSPFTSENRYETLFAVSCCRQIKSDELLNRHEDVTRSTVQKALVVVSFEPIYGRIRDKLSIVTNAFFNQRNFDDRSIIESLYESLETSLAIPPSTESKDSIYYIGISVRKAIYGWKKDILLLLKSMLLEKKVIFYGNNVEYVCHLQLVLISLIPNLIMHLQKSGSSRIYEDTTGLKVADSFKSSDRQSVLNFLGFPLRIFEEGGLFAPYTPLQQLHDLKSRYTKHFIIGTSNSLLMEQRKEISDIFINCDSMSIEIFDKHLQNMLQLSNNDKKWMEGIVQIVLETWNENDENTPKNSQFEGSEDFLRWQFEDYFTGLLSSAKLDEYLERNKNNEIALDSVEETLRKNNPMPLFNISWVNEWKTTNNFKIFNRITDDRLFDLFEPKHIFTGTDPITQLQQKFVATFQNLKRSNIQSTNNIRTASNITQSSELKTEYNTSEDCDNNSNNNVNVNVWDSWKVYFNNLKKSNDNRPDSGDEQDMVANNDSTSKEKKSGFSTFFNKFQVQSIKNDESLLNAEQTTPQTCDDHRTNNIESGKGPSKSNHEYEKSNGISNKSGSESVTGSIFSSDSASRHFTPEHMDK